MNYDAVVGFLDALRHRALVLRDHVELDFTCIKLMEPSSALVLAAEIDRWRLTRELRLRTLEWERWDPSVQRLLYELGFFGLLNVEVPHFDHDHSSAVRMIKMTSDEGAVGALASRLREELEAIVGPIEAAHFLYDGITEAMTNVGHHAYPPGCRTPYPKLQRRWWMSGAYNRDDGRLKVMVYDQGVGIPATLPRSSLWERARGFLVQRRLLRQDDAAMIVAAMEASRSSTGIPGRGHGLSNIVQFVDNSLDGRLRILSRAGELVYQQGRHPRPIRRNGSLGGTLIEWEVSR